MKHRLSSSVVVRLHTPDGLNNQGFGQCSCGVANVHCGVLLKALNSTAELFLPRLHSLLQKLNIFTGDVANSRTIRQLLTAFEGSTSTLWYRLPSVFLRVGTIWTIA